MTRFVGSILTLLSLAAFAAASNCHVRPVILKSTGYGHRVQAIEVNDHHDYDYRISYAPDLSEVVKILVDELRTEREENRAWKAQFLKAGGVGGGPLLPLKAAHPGDLVMANRCAVCHDETTAKAKGGGKTYFKGGAFIDSPENVSAVIGAAIEDASMPKGGKLTAEEKLDLMRRLVVQTGK